MSDIATIHQLAARQELLNTWNIDIDEASWEEFQTIWGELFSVSQGVLWAQALVCAAIDIKWGDETIKGFAQSVGLSPITIYRYRNTWKTFYQIEDRYPNLSFTHHAIAATTNDPHYWLQWSEEHEASSFALQRQIHLRENQTKVEIIEKQRELPPEAFEDTEQSATEVVVEALGDDIELPLNNNVILSASPPPTYNPSEEKALKEELDNILLAFVRELVGQGYLVGDIIGSFSNIKRNLLR